MSNSGKRLITPLTCWLAVFALINGLAINKVLHHYMSRPTSLDYADGFVHMQVQDNESWSIMRYALDKPKQAGLEARFYQMIFFARHIKLQYPPTALLMIHPFHELQLDVDDVLNWVSWIAAIGLALVTSRIYLRSLSQYLELNPGFTRERCIRLFS